MAELSITAANVLPATTATIARGTAGETLVAGQTVYIKTTDSNKIYKCQCDGTQAEAELAGLTINGAAAGQPISYVTSGDVTIGSASTAGRVIVVGTTAGAAMPSADLATNNYTSVLGGMKSASVLKVSIINTQTQYG